MAPSEASDQAPSAHPWLKDFVLTWLSRFGIFLAHHVTRPLLPLYLITFGASSTVIGAVMAVFTITATAMRIPIGLLIDRVGRKPFLLYGIACFTAGKLGYLWAPSILLMLPFRVLHGLGWSGCTTAVSTISADIVPQSRRGVFLGYAGIASSLASALGPVLGFALYHRYDFPGVFLGASALLVLSFIFGVPVAEPQRVLTEAIKAERWIDNLMVKESLDPAIGVMFLSFGHGGILTFLPIHALKIGVANPGIWFAVYAACILLSRPIDWTDLGQGQPPRRDHPRLDFESRRHHHAGVRHHREWLIRRRDYRRVRHRRGTARADDISGRSKRRRAPRSIAGAVSIFLRPRHRRRLLDARRVAACLVDAHDPSGLAHTLERVLEDRALAQDLRRRGLERSQRLDWKDTAARTLAFYRRILGH